MKILYVGEDNVGGGAKSNLNLAISASKYAEVAFIGCDKSYPALDSIILTKSKASNAISLRFILDFYHSVKKFNPDIVHATGMYTGLVALIIRSIKRTKYKIVMTLHHTSEKFRFNVLAKRLISVLNRIDYIHYLSEYQMNKYIKLGLIPEKYKIIPNIIETTSLNFEEVNSLRQKLLIKTSSDFLVVFVGRLVESKQIEMFIETVYKMNQLGYRTGGIIVGAGNMQYINILINKCRELKIEDKITFEGFILRPEIYINACDFCLFPTAHDEALPLFILESFSQKRTLVVSNHPSIKDIVKNQYDSIVAEEHTSEDYAKHCIKLIENHDLKHRLEEGAEISFKNSYDPEYIKRSFKELYFEMLSHSS